MVFRSHVVIKIATYIFKGSMDHIIYVAFFIKKFKRRAIKMLVLCAANNFDESLDNKDCIPFPDKLYKYLNEEGYRYNYEKLSLLTGLPLYDDYTFNETELYDLKELSDKMIQSTWGYEKLSDLNAFFIKLQKLCELAIEKKKLITSIGD